MDEAKLQEIEARSLRAVPKCSVCNATARWTTGAYRMTEDFCEACMPKSRYPLSRIQFAELDSIDLVAEVRRLTAALDAVTAERDVYLAQQAPLVALFDEVMAAARMAGLRGAGHEPAEVVAWVRRGEREACACIADDEMRDSEGNDGAVCAAQSIAAKIRGRKGCE